MVERFIAPVLKTGDVKSVRGFESHPLRQFDPQEFRMSNTQKVVPSIRHKIIIGFGLAAIMLAGVGFITYRSTREFLMAAQREAQSRQILEVQQLFLRHLMEWESGVWGFMISGNEENLLPYGNIRDQLSKEFSTLDLLTSDQPIQKSRLEKIKPLVSEKLLLLNRAVDAKRSGGCIAATKVLADGHSGELMEGINNTLDDFERDEQKLLLHRSELIKGIGRTTTFVILLATLLSVVFLVFAGSVILRDISARRKAEEALAEEHNLFGNIMDALPDQVFVKDLEGRFVIDNLSHRKFLGVKSIEEVEGKRELDFFPNEIARKYTETDQKVISTGEPVINFEEPVVDRDGKIIWLSITKLPLLDTDGNMIGIVCVSANIDERKESEEKLRMAASQLQRSNNELQEFASVASHDLQEPLRKIQAFGDRLKLKCGESLNQTGHEYLERMQDAAQRMQTLLHDLLTLSRVTSKAQPFESVPLRNVLSQVVSNLEVRIEQLGASIDIGNLPTAEVDASQMQQLFQNLISNALKFQRSGVKPEVIISSKNLVVEDQVVPGALPGDAVCQIFIQDNGIGFDEKYAERIFTVFQRLHSRSEYEGTGIGLAVCRKIMERHGGSITAKSTEGEGATFIVTLPLKQRINETND